MTLAELARDGTRMLERAGIDGAARDARVLLAHASGIAADRLSLEMGQVAGDRVAQMYSQSLTRRAARVPVAQIVGERAFFRHVFNVTADVLDPRPETETLVEAALAAPFSRVLDLGTGSGAIVLSLLAAHPAAQGVGTDMSEAAIIVATGNAERIGVTDRVSWVRSDWFNEVTGTFDLIVSNPPYIAADEMPGLAPELSHEPRMALTDEGDGLGAYRAITGRAMAHLAPGGRLMVEIGATQGAVVAGMARDAGWERVTILPDVDGRNRVVTAKRPV